MRFLAILVRVKNSFLSKEEARLPRDEHLGHAFVRAVQVASTQELNSTPLRWVQVQMKSPENYMSDRITEVIKTISLDFYVCADSDIKMLFYEFTLGLLNDAFISFDYIDSNGRVNNGLKIMLK
jgi:hypothetical protein